MSYQSMPSFSGPGDELDKLQRQHGQQADGTGIGAAADSSGGAAGWGDGGYNPAAAADSNVLAAADGDVQQAAGQPVAAGERERLVLPSIYACAQPSASLPLSSATQGGALIRCFSAPGRVAAGGDGGAAGGLPQARSAEAGRPQGPPSLRFPVQVPCK
jgi:hypothetical protein